jgi:Tfp pilus assembly protein PilP
MRDLPEGFPLATLKATGQLTNIGKVQIVFPNGHKTEKTVRKIMMGLFVGEQKLVDIETIIIPFGKVV